MAPRCGPASRCGSARPPKLRGARYAQTVPPDLVRFRLQIRVAVAKFLTAGHRLLRQWQSQAYPIPIRMPNFPYLVSKGAMAQRSASTIGATPLGVNEPRKGDLDFHTKR